MAKDQAETSHSKKTDEDNEMRRQLIKDRKFTQREHRKNSFEKDIDTSSKDVSTEDFNICSENDSSLWELLRNKFTK